MRSSVEKNRIERNAKAFGIVPELAWLMENQPLWDQIQKAAMLLNKGANADDIADLRLPTDQLRFNLAVLAMILRERK